MRNEKTISSANQASTAKTQGSSVQKKRSSSARHWITKLAAPIVLAVVTIYAVNRYLTTHSQTDGSDSSGAVRAQLVVAQNLAAGTVIEMSHLASRDLPQTWFGPNSIDPDDVDQVLGLALIKDFTAGTSLSREALRKIDPNEFLEQLDPDRRAVTLPVDLINSTTGLLHPGEFIDLYVTFDHKGRRITSLLVSHVEVLKIANSGSGLTQEQEMLTLDVSPQQAAKLIAAQHDGVLTAVQMPVTNKQDSETPVADHLAGYVGIEDSFEQRKVPDIIYADMAAAFGTKQP